MGWFKDMFTRRKGAKGAASALLCDSCNLDLQPGDGYMLASRDVVLSQAHWEEHFKRFKRLMVGEALFTIALRMRADDSTGWHICEECSEQFVFDRDEARAHVLRNTIPAGVGPVDTAEFVHVAAAAWERVFGSWPSVVRQPEVVDPCDMCGKKMYVDELSSSVPEHKFEEYRSAGFLDHDPAREPRLSSDGDDTGWQICQPCTAILLCRTHRAGIQPG